MTEKDKEIAIQTVKDILHILHEKRYEDLPSCVDEMEWDDTEEIRECIQGTLDMNDFDTFDEYGVPCNFRPQYEYHHEVEFYERPEGFDAEYDLTAGGELVYLRLQLRFLYLEGRVKRIFHTIDPM
ncbi:MAG: hypothetical protein K2K54_13950 [Lachnospiraceae bacterium]|nr:hypothetical protein [Lachnospiraceae bacterium]